MLSFELTTIADIGMLLEYAIVAVIAFFKWLLGIH